MNYPLRFLVVAGYAESLTGFRAPLISELQHKGFEVHVAAPGLSNDSVVRMALENKGFVVHDIPLRRTGMNPFHDLRTLLFLCSMMFKLRPAYLLTYTIKPIIYGSLAGWIARVPYRVALITGLGHAFVEDSAAPRHLEKLVSWMYRLALRCVRLVFFQNPDDEALFRQKAILGSSVRSFVVNGSGVDVSEFYLAPQPRDKLAFLLIARLLYGKGVRVYAQAAQRIRQYNPEVSFGLVGWIDDNPDAITQKELDSWVSEGTIEYFGRQSDVRPLIEACSVYVLPSYYREGTPRSVLEAMAMGRAIITTDTPGCRETVVEGENGFLVPIKNVDALVQAMERFIDDPSLIERMGMCSREIAEDKYDVHKVNAVMLREMGL